MNIRIHHTIKIATWTWKYELLENISISAYLFKNSLSEDFTNSQYKKLILSVLKHVLL
jgi:hypothetical protein